jgi:hypothetical protein
MEDVGLFYVQLVYSSAKFGIFNGHLVYFFSFWYVASRKIWQLCVRLYFQEPLLHFSALRSYNFENCITSYVKAQRKCFWS